MQRQRHEGIRPLKFTQLDGFDSKHAWITRWVGLQPLRRRLGLVDAQVSSPESLYSPADTLPPEWSTFWSATRQVVFATLLGLKNTAPDDTPRRSEAHSMNRHDWLAWVADVFWSFQRMVFL